MQPAIGKVKSAMLHKNILKIQDEMSSGGVYNELELILSTPQVTAREIIETRVRRDIKSYAERASDYMHSLVVPQGAEVALNGSRLSKHRPIDAERQIATAFNAFANNGFFMLVDDRQVEDLDESFAVTDETTVKFIKLVPLVGG